MTIGKEPVLCAVDKGPLISDIFMLHIIYSMQHKNFNDNELIMENGNWQAWPQIQDFIELKPKSLKPKISLVLSKFQNHRLVPIDWKYRFKLFLINLIKKNYLMFNTSLNSTKQIQLHSLLQECRLSHQSFSSVKSIYSQWTDELITLI